jgi:hypothetical protein
LSNYHGSFINNKKVLTIKIKIMLKFKFLVIILLICFTVNVSGQDAKGEITSLASAELLIPMAVSEVEPLHFGTIVNVTAATGGTVVMSSTSDLPTYTTVKARTPGTAIPPKRGEFGITGTPNEEFNVGTIANFNLTNQTNGTSTLVVSDVTYSFDGSTNSTNRTASLDSSGDSPLYIGGTLTIPANQDGGLYTGSYTVTVDYN